MNRQIRENSDRLRDRLTNERLTDRQANACNTHELAGKENQQGIRMVEHNLTFIRTRKKFAVCLASRTIHCYCQCTSLSPSFSPLSPNSICSLSVCSPVCPLVRLLVYQFKNNFFLIICQPNVFHFSEGLTNVCSCHLASNTCLYQLSNVYSLFIT